MTYWESVAPDAKQNTNAPKKAGIAAKPPQRTMTMAVTAGVSESVQGSAGNQRVAPSVINVSHRHSNAVNMNRSIARYCRNVI